MPVKEIKLDSYTIERILDHLKHCFKLMQEKKRGTYPEGEVDEIESLIRTLEKKIEE